MEKQSIKINIAGRTIPVVAENQEESIAIHEAARLINEKIIAYRNQYTMLNDLDIVLMCCLEISTSLVKLQNVKNTSNVHISEVLQHLSEIEQKLEISHYLDEA